MPGAPPLDPPLATNGRCQRWQMGVGGHSFQQNYSKQEIIPVGCVLPSCPLYLGEGSLLTETPFQQGHNRRPPHQKTTSEGHNRRPLSTRRPYQKAAFNQKATKPEGHNGRPHQKAITEGHNRRPHQKAITEGHNRRPHQKAITEDHFQPEDHTRRLPSIRRLPNQKGIMEDHSRRP